jgi:hypothetical protein
LPRRERQGTCSIGSTSDHIYYAVNLKALGVVHGDIVHGAGDVDLAALGGEQLDRIEMPDGADRAFARLRLV